jgi:hypothetical protein
MAYAHIDLRAYIHDHICTYVPDGGKFVFKNDRHKWHFRTVFWSILLHRASLAFSVNFRLCAAPVAM